MLFRSRVRRALAAIDPDAKVEVTAAPVPAPPSAAGEGPNLSETADPFDSWTPASRTFALSVAVSTTTPLTLETQEQMRAAAAEAVGVDPALGDLVTVSPAVPAWEAGRPVGPPTASVPPPTLARNTPYSFWMLVVGALLVLLLAAAAVLHRRSSAPRKLSVQQRQTYAERLRLLLEDGGANAT